MFVFFSFNTKKTTTTPAEVSKPVPAQTNTTETWNSVEFEDQQRKEKFLKLMGAKKPNNAVPSTTTTSTTNKSDEKKDKKKEYDPSKDQVS